MKKFLCLSLTLIMALAFTLSFSGCSLNNTAVYDNKYSGYYSHGEKFFLKAGETVELDIKEIFGDIKSYTLYSSDTSVVTVRGDKITARGVGIAKIGLVTDKKAPAYTGSCAATVFVTDEGHMTEIRTAQDLDNMRNDLGGFYILKPT